MSNVKQPTLFQAVMPLLILVVTGLFSILHWKVGMYLPIITGIVATALLGKYLGYKWTELERYLFEGVSRALTPIFILFMIGLIIATWILSGVIPTLIYYGLEIMSPSTFIPTVAVVSAIISVATGSSFTSIATVGIAFMAVGIGMGFPPALVAGAVISGAFLGDKNSPLSETTNLASALVGTDIFSHIKHMMWDAIPAFIISLALYWYIGGQYVAKTENLEQIQMIQNTLDQMFNINPVLLLLPLLTLYITFKRLPVVPTLLLISILGGIAAIIFQGSTFSHVIQVMTFGYKSQSGVKIIDSLLNQGGLTSTFDVNCLAIIAVALGGILEGIGVFNSILNSFIHKAKNTGSLIVSTLISIFVVGFASGVQILAIIIPARTFAKTYRERGLDTKNLSRCIEAAGAVGSILVPWSVPALFAQKMLGVNPIEFIPYVFFAFLVPLFNIIYGITGFTIAKKTYPDAVTSTICADQANKEIQLSNSGPY
ncbi:Na+/H+ antiporter NhaC [Peribacillus butanolivorans]|uniref:Na+/H+ antiporter NhaC n=1 Tax=Peribacillus butanolivorans TaxID=421767 RepID=UPI00365AEC05